MHGFRELLLSTFALSALFLGCSRTTASAEPNGPETSAAPPPSASTESHGDSPHGDSSQANADHEFHRPTHSFEDPAAWSQVFDAPERDAWQKPNEVIAQLHLAPDATVADIGTGTGYFTVRLAAAVPRGKVLAVDVEQGLVDFVKERAQKENLSNVEVRLAPTDDPQLPAASVDVALVVNTYHHIAERVDYFTKVRQALKPGGRLVLVEWRMGRLDHGPPDQHKLPPEVISRELSEAGFKYCREWDDLPYQHVLFYGVSC